MQKYIIEYREEFYTEVEAQDKREALRKAKDKINWKAYNNALWNDYLKATKTNS